MLIDKPMTKECQYCHVRYSRPDTESLRSWSERCTCGKAACRNADRLTKKNKNYQRPLHPMIDLFLRLSVNDYRSAIKLNRQAG